MIGFSVSFLKALHTILQDLKETNEVYYFIFSKILSSASDGECEVYLDLYKDEVDANSVIHNLKYNGFDVSIVESDDICTLILVKW